MTDGWLELPLDRTVGANGWPAGSLVATMLIVMTLVGVLNATLTHSPAARLPTWGFIALLAVANIALLGAILPVLTRIHARARENTRIVLRVGPEAIEVHATGRPPIRVPRADLRVRRLRLLYDPPTSDSGRGPTLDLVALELRGPGLDPVVLYQPSPWRHEPWAEPDDILRQLPEFQLEEPGWTTLRESLGIPR